MDLEAVNEIKRDAKQAAQSCPDHVAVRHQCDGACGSFLRVHFEQASHDGQVLQESDDLHRSLGALQVPKVMEDQR
ncbi:MAG TPA: hypothetical protein VFE62_26670, partial [Gemmataceae bacterium]|nr:hypothetical protein [Gemmataceae bacterium]